MGDLQVDVRGRRVRLAVLPRSDAVQFKPSGPIRADRPPGVAALDLVVAVVPAGVGVPEVHVRTARWLTVRAEHGGHDDQTFGRCVRLGQTVARTGPEHRAGIDRAGGVRAVRRTRACHGTSRVLWARSY